MSHTLGPWEFIDDGVMAGDVEVAIAPLRDDLNPTEWQANGRLLAAAPELLAACKAFVQSFEKSLQLEKTDVALRLAKASIAKAEGQ
jgi:hypothetical protein